MTDLIDRLRGMKNCMRDIDCELYEEAADRIEELEAALRPLHEAACRIWNAAIRDGDLDLDDVIDWLARPSDMARRALGDDDDARAIREAVRAELARITRLRAKLDAREAESEP